MDGTGFTNTLLIHAHWRAATDVRSHESAAARTGVPVVTVTEALIDLASPDP